MRTLVIEEKKKDNLLLWIVVFKQLQGLILYKTILINDPIK